MRRIGSILLVSAALAALSACREDEAARPLAVAAAPGPLYIEDLPLAPDALALPPAPPGPWAACT